MSYFDPIGFDDPYAFDERAQERHRVRYLNEQMKVAATTGDLATVRAMREQDLWETLAEFALDPDAPELFGTAPRATVPEGGQVAWCRHAADTPRPPVPATGPDYCTCTVRDVRCALVPDDEDLLCLFCRKACQ